MVTFAPMQGVPEVVLVELPLLGLHTYSDTACTHIINILFMITGANRSASRPNPLVGRRRRRVSQWRWRRTQACVGSC